MYIDNGLLNVSHYIANNIKIKLYNNYLVCFYNNILTNNNPSEYSFISLLIINLSDNSIKKYENILNNYILKNLNSTFDCWYDFFDFDIYQGIIHFLFLHNSIKTLKWFYEESNYDRYNLYYSFLNIDDLINNINNFDLNCVLISNTYSNFPSTINLTQNYNNTEYL